MRMTNQELGAVLAGLRLLQWNLENGGTTGLPDGIEDVLTDGATFEALEPEDIDTLCVRINGGEPAPEEQDLDARASPEEEAAATAESLNRWACPECGSRNVEISLPTWYLESKTGQLAMVSTDEEADPLYWYCQDCFESGNGEPIDLNDEGTP